MLSVSDPFYLLNHLIYEYTHFTKRGVYFVQLEYYKMAHLFLDFLQSVSNNEVCA